MRNIISPTPPRHFGEIKTTQALADILSQLVLLLCFQKIYKFSQKEESCES
jgi:hypothetical protein